MSEPGPARNSSGFLVSNITKFPSGMEGTISQILSLGFRGFGMYDNTASAVSLCRCTRALREASCAGMRP